MLKLTFKLIPFRTIKLIIKLLASLASAIVVVSGYLFFISNAEKNRASDITIAEEEPEDQD